MTETSGGEVLARMLKAEGVEKVFGIIDGTYFGFYSNLHKLGIEIVTPRHETCAAHMAGAYARLTGKLGVCMASNGPGVANVLPGLAVENAEGNRVLAITSCRRPQIVYPDRGGAYQAFDQVGAIKHLAKWSAAVVSFDRVAELGRTALRHCYEGRPGRRAPRRARDDHERQGEGGRADLAAAPVPAHRAGSAATRAGRACRGAAGGRGTADHPRRQRRDTRRRLRRAAPRRRDAAGAGHDQLGRARRAARDLGCRDPDAYVQLNHVVRNDADLVLVVGSRLGETDWWGKAPYWRHPSEQKMIQVDIDGHMLGLEQARGTRGARRCEAVPRGARRGARSRGPGA